MLSSHGLAALQVRFNKKNQGTFPKYTTPMETVVYRLVHQREPKVLRSSHQPTHMESNVAVARCMGSLERFKSHKAKMRFKHHVIRWNSEVILVYLADVFAKILDERSIR